MTRGLAGGLLLAALPSPAIAQSFGVEATTDEVRRGLSWSGGRASASADAALGLGHVEASARAAALRGSPRHSGADAVIDTGLATSFDIGPARLRLEGVHHAFTGASGKADFSELGASADYTYGPVQLVAGAFYAPSQASIGGSNLYLYANANAGIPATPVTLTAGIGRSSGDVDNSARSQRLRPGGTYLNWRLGAEYSLGVAAVGIDYLGSNAACSGNRVAARLRFGF